MRPLRAIQGTASPYPKGNVDTDEIVPARFLLRDRKEGFSEFLFRDLRFDGSGAERADFVLNQPKYRGAKVLVAGANFGCGSSREHAVWALLDYGIDAVIAPSFGDIFRNNALQNGLLLIQLPHSTVEQLSASLAASTDARVDVDLPSQQVSGPDGRAYGFEIEPHDKAKLLEGRSKIDETLALESEIERFEQNYRATFPWAARK
jgi:3-isopropylmalate/(R)-2-methylmalate dehydratase small subunit